MSRPSEAETDARRQPFARLQTRRHINTQRPQVDADAKDRSVIIVAHS
ncbi:MAG: hypothetical protein SLRJCFUN_001911, partial [Candidatus Fervidibacter sp.]